MKIGIFGDIHGNLYAFEKIYELLKKESCDMHVFTGDVCGYYYQQNEVIDILREIPNLQSVAGNHDIMFLESLEDPYFLMHYSKNFSCTFDLLQGNISGANLTFLKNLREELLLHELNIAVYHGSPWRPFVEYVYPDSPLDRFEEVPFEVVFLGHTHHPMDRTHAGVRVINPGSAGQPRDRGWPSFALYDTETKKTEIKRVPYDVNPLIRDIKNMNENKPYLIEVLQRAQP
jgi:putative phosphoesterase